MQNIHTYIHDLDTPILLYMLFEFYPCGCPRAIWPGDSVFKQFRLFGGMFEVILVDTFSMVKYGHPRSAFAMPWTRLLLLSA